MAQADKEKPIIKVSIFAKKNLLENTRRPNGQR
jgi:hypothetical protein